EAYDAVTAELEEDGGARICASTRHWLANEAFAQTARYDAAISRWFSASYEDFPEHLAIAYEKVIDLSYGENPHQRAALYAEAGARSHILSRVSKLHGRALSFNNVLDLDSARGLVGDFEQPACVIVKHNNPCGCALGASGLEAYRRAFESDPMSAFGGVIAFNVPVDGELARALVGQFLELVVAPGFDAEALEALGAKPNVRVLENGERRRHAAVPEFRQVLGGVLIQDRDIVLEERAQMTVVTERAPTEAEWTDLLFAWRVCRHVRSNAIVLARDGATVGIGAGQMSRVDSVRLAIEKSRLDSLAGSSLASDAYFPFADGPELAIAAGVSAIIQPGGSIRDADTIAAADRAGVAMVATGRRHFRH
ncbi:MAG: phosphoribosylaminoimidazolecarboxamide formyltransferase / cyclohydrolase, partial [Solirubrobacteraceae bacterium]|nr:phosphoribosylaminoimidazolecarboxamide formyltransferase / cyclohydrolase [Solirubrobacteraceae bacterium]